MNCYCYETETEFIFCVKDVDTRFTDNLEAAWFKPSEIGYLKIYNKDMKDNGVNEDDKALVARNFSRLGNSMFEGIFDWEEALLLLTTKFNANKIEWYIIGSCSEAVLGVDVNPHDIDIIVHTKDFFRVKNIMSDYVVEPFVDNNGTWVVRYFGRLCLAGAIIDIAADIKMNAENHQYEEVKWNNYDVVIEPLDNRYQTELVRGREERIKVIEEYMKLK